MSLSQSERAKIVVRYLAQKAGIKQFDIGRKMGYTNKSAFSAVLGGQKSLPRYFCERLAALDPEINLAFLTGESNEMLLPGKEQPPVPELSFKQPAASGVYLPLELVKLFTNLSDTIRSQQETIRILAVKGDADEKAM